MPDVTAKDDVLLDVATVLRGNARAAQKMSEKIKIFLRNNTVFTPSNWNDIKSVLGILPLGLNNMELTILKYLKDNPSGTPLTMLSAKTGLSREALQKDAELYLQKHSLMEIATTGRQITSKGHEYLNNLAVV